MKWEGGNMVAVRWEWTTQGPQAGRRPGRADLGKAMSLHNHTHWPPRSQQAFMNRLLYQKPVSVVLLMGSLLWQSRLIKLSGMLYFGTYKNWKRVMLWKNSLGIAEVSNKTAVLGKCAHDTLWLGMRWVQISHRQSLLPEIELCVLTQLLKWNPYFSLTSSGTTCWHGNTGAIMAKQTCPSVGLP